MQLNCENISKELIQEMSDEEIAMWYSALQQQEQIQKMKQALLRFVDLRDTERQCNTIKIPSKVID